MEKSILTAVGKDKVSILWSICGILVKNNVNVLDVSQTIIDGYFNMIMIVDTGSSKECFKNTQIALEDLGREIGLTIKLQKDSIFDAMHRV